jgi:hypothetical protein
MRVTREGRAPIGALIALFCVIAFCGCGEKETGGVQPNLPPETALAYAPGEGDTVDYRVRLNWFGWDPDGEVTHFLARWDSLDWFATVRTESVFLVETRTSLRDSPHDYRPHTFEVKSVDNDGAEDPTPESVTFTATNAHPDTEILSGPSGVVGAFAEFEWIGTDADGEVAGYGYRLSRRDGYEWVVVAVEDSLGADETAVLFGPIDAHAIRHRFEVWAVDDQGAADRTPATREFTTTSWGPELRIRTNHLGNRGFIGTDWDSPEHVPPIEILAGEHLVFDWSAEPDVVGYRHAYDDTLVWPEWSLEDRHFEVVAEPGLRTLYVSAKDLAERQVRGRIRLDVREATLDGYILIVDDYNWLEQFPQWGTDEDRSTLYDHAVAPFGMRIEWDTSEQASGSSRLAEPPDVEILGGASTVIWYTDGEQTALAWLFDEYNRGYNPLAGYLRIGGNLLFCGFETVQQIASRPYPVETTPSDTSTSLTFLRDGLHIGRAESSGQSANKSRPWQYGYCFYGAVPSEPGFFEPMYIDSLGKWWPIYGSSHPNYSHGGLPMVEKLVAYEGEAVGAFGIDSFLNMGFDGETCALLHLTGSDRGNVCYLGFPLYYLQTPHVEAFFDELLPLFGEERR